MEQMRLLEQYDDIDKRLAELGLEKEILLEIRDRAHLAGANATLSHPANASGIFAYLEGVRSLRDLLIGKNGWEKLDYRGVAAICNHKLNIRLGYTNVDFACQEKYEPQPRSPKGDATEKLCQSNNALPLFTGQQGILFPLMDQVPFYFLMIGSNGAVELSRVTINNGKFKDFLERNFLSDAIETSLAPIETQEAYQPTDADLHITRKK